MASFINIFSKLHHTLKSWDPQALRACVWSRFSRVLLFATPWTVALQAPLSMGFSRKEYWSGLPCLSQGLQILLCVLWFSCACVESRILLWQKKGGTQAQGMGNEWAAGWRGWKKKQAGAATPTEVHWEATQSGSSSPALEGPQHPTGHLDINSGSIHEAQIEHLSWVQPEHWAQSMWL